MTIGDANAVQTLLAYLVGRDPDPDQDRARQAAAHLADRSRALLSAGRGADTILERWPADQPAPIANRQDPTS